MKRMTVFTRPDHSRFAIAAFDIRRVYQQADPIKCRIVYLASKDESYQEASEIVVGTFDDTLARIEEGV